MLACTDARTNLGSLLHFSLDNVDLATFLHVFDTLVPGTFQKMILVAEDPSGDVPSDTFHFKGVSSLVRTS